MKNVLIKEIKIPINIKQEYSDFHVIELYKDCIICRGDKRERAFLFDNYKWICWLPKGFETEYAQLIFVVGDGETVEDTNRLLFSDNEFIENLYLDIVKTKKMPYPFG